MDKNEEQMISAGRGCGKQCWDFKLLFKVLFDSGCSPDEIERLWKGIIDGK